VLAVQHRLITQRETIRSPEYEMDPDNTFSVGLIDGPSGWRGLYRLALLLLYHLPPKAVENKKRFCTHMHYTR